MLRSRGTDANLIQLLIKDAQLLDSIKTNHKMQTETLQSFQSKYASESWRVTHEQSFDEVKKRINEIKDEVQDFGQSAQDELNTLSDQSQNTIQLVFPQDL